MFSRFSCTLITALAVVVWGERGVAMYRGGPVRAVTDDRVFILK